VDSRTEWQSCDCKWHLLTPRRGAALGQVCAHLVSLELLWQPPIKRLCVDVLMDSLSIQQDVRGLEIHPLGGAPQVTQ
jgi:hypothetical protein